MLYHKKVVITFKIVVTAFQKVVTTFLQLSISYSAIPYVQVINRYFLTDREATFSTIIMLSSRSDGSFEGKEWHLRGKGMALQGCNQISERLVPAIGTPRKDYPNNPKEASLSFTTISTINDREHRMPYQRFFIFNITNITLMLFACYSTHCRVTLM